MTDSHPAPEAPSDPYDLVGKTLMGMYRVQSLLDRSGMGVVYLGENTSLGTRVVIKIPDPRATRESGFVERFRREIQSLVELRHPCVVRIQAQGVHEDIPFLVLDYLERGSLETRIREEGPCSLEAMRSWAGVIADTLDTIHSEGVVHRDVKPSNILFDRRGHPVLSDFGLAYFGARGSERLTATGIGVGTPLYMAPEQVAGGEATARSDQYGLAATVYEALTGQAPFGGGSLVQILAQKANESARDIRELRSDLPPDVCDAVMRGLSTSQDDRFASCRAFADRLGAPRGPALSSTSVGTDGPSGRSRRRRWAWLLLALPILLGAGVLFFEPPDREDEASRPRTGVPPVGAYKTRWLRPPAGAYLGVRVVEVAVEVPAAPQTASARMRLVGRDFVSAWIEGRRDDDTFLLESEAPAEGRARIELRIDGEGIEASRVTREVVFDWTPPVLEVTHPAGTEAECLEPVLQVRGRVADANPVVVELVVELGEERVFVDADGTFQHHLQLPADAPATFSLVARDQAGNASRAGPFRVSLCKPDRRYAIDLRSPADGADVPELPLLVEGRVEPVDAGTPDLVFVNGDPVAVREGTFRTEISAEGDGDLEITVGIRGNGFAPATVTRSVTIDTTPPVIELRPPAPEEVASRVRIRGWIRDANPKEILVEGTSYPVEPDGSFELPLPWQPEREIDLVAIDRAGNASTPVTRAPDGDTPVRVVVLGPRDGEKVPHHESGVVPITASVRGLQAEDEVFIDGERASRVGDSVLHSLHVTREGAHRVSVLAKRGDRVLAEEEVTFEVVRQVPYTPSIYREDTRGHWRRSLGVAQREAKESERHVLALFTRSDRGAWDRRVDLDVFSDPGLLAWLRDRYVLVALDDPADDALRRMAPREEAVRVATRRYRVAETPCVVLMLPDGTPYARLHRGQLLLGRVQDRVLDAHAVGLEAARLLAEGAEPPSTDRLGSLLKVLATGRLLVDPAYEELVGLARRRDPDRVLGVAAQLETQRAEARLWELREGGASADELHAHFRVTKHLQGRYFVETLFDVVDALRASGDVSGAKTLMARIPLDPTWSQDAWVRYRYEVLLEALAGGEDR